MLEKLDIRHFDEVYEILKDSFPANERRYYNKQKELLSKEYYNIYVLRKNRESNIEAFIATYEFEKVIFIEHFAVIPKYRNQGLGTIIIKRLMDTTEKIICLEVELPLTEIAKRRIEFYKRNGFYINDYPYRQPSLGDNKKTISMILMSSKKILNKDEFEDIKSTIYKEVYNYIE